MPRPLSSWRWTSPSFPWWHGGHALRFGAPDERQLDDGLAGFGDGGAQVLPIAGQRQVARRRRR
jgi:hypothetical protein